MNTTTKAVGNFFGNVAQNATKAANTAANSAVKAANAISDAAVETTSTLATNVNKAANALSFNSLLPFGNNGNKKNNSGNLGAAAANKGTNNAGMFSNVTPANLGNSGNSGGPSMPAWAGLAGVFLLLVGVFVMAFVFFKNEIQVAYENVITTIRRALGYSTGAEPELKMPEMDVTSPVDTTTDKLALASQEQKSIVEKVLPLGSKEVFNVNDNDYTFYDAEPLCRALGAELATYDQVKDAWEKGADWCNYGWVKGQVAVYPTQKETWEKLQNGPEDEKFACGNPGVNGGFFDNPEMRFGVNCYGVKPPQSSNDQKVLMERGSIPKTPAVLKIDQQTQEYKSQMDEIAVLPFNGSQWST